MRLVLCLCISVLIAGLESIDEEKSNSLDGKSGQNAKIPPTARTLFDIALSVGRRNETMDFKEIKVQVNFSNGTHNGTNPVEVGQIVAPSHPTDKEEDNKLYGVDKPLYFAVLAFIFQMQVPLISCLNRGFRRIGLSLVVCYILCLVSAYYIMPTDMWLEDTPTRFNFWFATPCVLTYISLSTLGWINLLTCDLVMSFLIFANQGAISEKNGVVIKRYSGILNLSGLVSITISVFTFVAIHSRMIENVTGLPDGIDNLAKMLPYFFPSVLILFSINVVFYVVGGSHKWWKVGKNTMYFGLLVCVVINWIFGCIIVIKEVWSAWYVFALVSVILAGLALRALYMPDEFEENELVVDREEIVFDIEVDDKMALVPIKVKTPKK